MIKKIFKTIPLLILSMCIMMSNNVGHAGSGQSSGGVTSQDGEGSCGGGGATTGF